MSEMKTLKEICGYEFAPSDEFHETLEACYYAAESLYHSGYSEESEILINFITDEWNRNKEYYNYCYEKPTPLELMSEYHLRELCKILLPNIGKNYSAKYNILSKSWEIKYENSDPCDLDIPFFTRMSPGVYLRDIPENIDLDNQSLLLRACGFTIV